MIGMLSMRLLIKGCRVYEIDAKISICKFCLKSYLIAYVNDCFVTPLFINTEHSTAQYVLHIGKLDI